MEKEQNEKEMSKSLTAFSKEETVKGLHKFHILNSIAWILLFGVMLVVIALYLLSRKDYGFQIVLYYLPSWLPPLGISLGMLFCSEWNLRRLEKPFKMEE